MLTAIIFIYAIVLLALIVGSYTDMKTREVPDWLNYSLIGVGIGVNALLSIIESDWSYIIGSAIGVTVCTGIALLMFYAGQWGGGDSKLLIGLGALLGFTIVFEPPFFRADDILVAFFVNIAFVGFFYALLWSSYLALRNFRKFWKELKKNIKAYRKWTRIMLVISILAIPAVMFIPDFFIRLAIVTLVILCLSTLYIWFFVKSVENSSMYKLVEPTALTEGDWIAKDVKVGKKRICGPKDLGIEKKQIAQLIQLRKRGKVKKILIKEGIPFVPSFLLSFIVSLAFGNLVLLFF
ncbi:MAG: prepilin peptidase [bacterium]|nr:prepilin peptidase [bacterium]